MNPATALLDRLIRHDAASTAVLIERAQALSPTALDAERNLGPGSIRKTVHHIVEVMEGWCDRMRGLPQRTTAAADASFDEQFERLRIVTDDLFAWASELASDGQLEESFLDHRHSPPRAKTFAGALLHVATHGMHHRAQLAAMLREAGADDIPEGDLLSWERQRREVETGDADIPAPEVSDAKVTVTPLDPERDREAYPALRARLWPGEPEVAEEAAQILAGAAELAEVVFVARAEDGPAVGFLEMRLRGEAEGCTGSPVPTVEGWFVETAWRGRGVGRALIEAAEAWARGRGYGELASDAEVDNRGSRAAHRALGFEELPAVVPMRKRLG